ncbi:MAG: peptidase S1 [Hyphomonas sp.]
MLSRLLGAAAVCAALALPAMAQDYSQDPFVEFELASGFDADPHVVTLTAGGSEALDKALAGCDAFVADRPDVRLNYTAGELPLYIFADSQADTLLLINDPDGVWHCDDDGGFQLNPMIEFDEPSSGQYDIWVGTVSEDVLPRATLYISEVFTE